MTEGSAEQSLPPNKPETYHVSQAMKDQMESHKPNLKKRALDMITSSGFLDHIEESGERVLDVGTGSGHVSELLKNEKSAKVMMIDLYDLRTSDVKDPSQKLDFAQADAHALPFKDESFTRVMLVDVLHHCKDPLRIIEEAGRVLKPDGKVLIIEDTIPDGSPTKEKIWKKVIGVMDDAANLQPRGVNPHQNHTVDEWIKMLQERGFNLETNKTWYWGPKDFLPGSVPGEHPDKANIMTPFPSTAFIFSKASPAI